MDAASKARLKQTVLVQYSYWFATPFLLPDPCASVLTHKYTHARTHTHIYTNTHTHAHAHTHTHKHTRARTEREIVKVNKFHSILF